MTTATLLVDVARQDISKLQATGWKPLTPITVKARDGKTDLYGFLFKPTNFDAAKRYPIVDYVYPGPQTGSCGSRSFSAAHKDMESLAELGFVVVCIDGMGTPDRSKSFHDALLRRHGGQHDSRPGRWNQGTGGEVSVDRCASALASTDTRAAVRRRRRRCSTSRTSSRSASARAATTTTACTKTTGRRSGSGC